MSAKKRPTAHEQWNVWKVVGAILLAGAALWLALWMWFGS